MPAGVMWGILKLDGGFFLLDFGVVFTEIAGGDSHAFDFCAAVYRLSDLLDDLIDGDKEPRGVEEIAAITLSAAMCFSLNPFFHKHKTELLSLIQSGMDAYAKSLAWTGSIDPNERLAATVLATQYQEIFWTCARLTGGQKHYDSIVAKYRHYEFEEPASLPKASHLPAVCWTDFDDSIFDFVCLKTDGDVNKDARDFCSALVRWLHSIDDAQDRDKHWAPEDLVRVHTDAIRAFAENSFFQANKLMLLPLLIQGFRAWADSAGWEAKEDIRDRRAADVFKSYYTETIFHVGYLCGGWDHMAQVTKRFRKVDHDFKEE